eukprot:TRINITY_DN31677_c0_g1_i1.p1 TRINITY_DN31677_c0_g1~~TRINITY_DN31677_c0_g1_i1.p1  ORF type:complete len:456 (-),score=73.84 TRINITY_DN31677_c0_g1_i1:530-1897(-)
MLLFTPSPVDGLAALRVPHVQHAWASRCSRRMQGGLQDSYESSSASVLGLGAVVAATSVCAHEARRKATMPLRRPSRVSLARAVSSANANDNETQPPASKAGVVLVNIGTPTSLEIEDVTEYLKRFLSDKPVVAIDDPKEKAIVLDRILKSAPQRSVAGYKKIWDPVRGSPLLFHSQDLADALQQNLGEEYIVKIGFQYSEPSMETALRSLMEADVDRIVLVPMFPHFSQATVGAFLANACRVAERVSCSTKLQVVPPFYKHAGYIAAESEVIAQVLGPAGCNVDHMVFSFHGIPEQQCSRTDESGKVCMKVDGCCYQRSEATRNCYRAQCIETAELLASHLGLEDDRWSVGFQSRETVRGAIRWTRPFTDKLLVELAERGLKRVAICAPSYTADCIETLGELGKEFAEMFKAAGGESLLLVPSVNSSQTWASELAQMIRDPPTASGGSRGYWAM